MKRVEDQLDDMRQSHIISPSINSTVGLWHRSISRIGSRCLSIISLDHREFEPVAERVQAEEPWPMGNRLGWQYRHSFLGQSAPVLFQVPHHQAVVPLICLA